MATAWRKAIGHGDAYGQIAWGDPGTGLSFSFVTNTAMHGVNAEREFERAIRLDRRLLAHADKSFEDLHHFARAFNTSTKGVASAVTLIQ